MRARPPGQDQPRATKTKTALSSLSSTALDEEAKTKTDSFMARMGSLYRDPLTLPSNLDPRIKVIKAQPYQPIQNISCVPLPASPRKGVMICIYPASLDIYVSAAIWQGKLFEQDHVMHMAHALKEDPSLQLVDIGANIGIYTLLAAAMRRKVLAVEMLPQNAVMIQNSLAKSPKDVAENVVLVNNALFSNYTELQVQNWDHNVAGTRVSAMRKDMARIYQKSKMRVNAVCMNDLLPLLTSNRVWIKMDIEGSEAAALQCADQFFSRLQVQVVMMEWLDRRPDNAAAILRFMRAHNFTATDVKGNTLKVTADTRTVGGHNIFWRKNNSL